MNDYEKVISDIGDVIEMEKLDSPSETGSTEQTFQVFGFGGIPRHMGINCVNHCFALNGNALNPEIQGISKVLKTYRSTLQQIDMAGPTYFGPLLE